MPTATNLDTTDCVILAVFRASLDTPELYYPDKTALLKESNLFQRYICMVICSLTCSREAQKHGNELRFVARDYANPEDFFDALQAETIQYVLLFTENAQLLQRLHAVRQAVRELRANYTDSSKGILSRVQVDDEERSMRKKEVLQQQVKCIHEIVKKRERDLDEVRVSILCLFIVYRVL